MKEWIPSEELESAIENLGSAIANEALVAVVNYVNGIDLVMSPNEAGDDCDVDISRLDPCDGWEHPPVLAGRGGPTEKEWRAWLGYFSLRQLIANKPECVPVLRRILAEIDAQKEGG